MTWAMAGVLLGLGMAVLVVVIRAAMVFLPLFAGWWIAYEAGWAERPDMMILAAVAVCLGITMEVMS